MNNEVFGMVYKITNKINGKVYIGVTKKESVSERYKGSIINTHNEHLRRSIEKYGVENFEIINQFDIAYSEEELNKLESYYINYYDSMNPKKGYNKTSGGDSKYIFSEESKKKMSKAHSGKKLTEEHKKKLSESRRGEKNHFYGKTHTDKVRKKISDTHKGKIISEEHRKIVSECWTGRKHSEETKQKMREWNIGKKMSEESKEKMRKAKGKEVYQYSKEGTFINKWRSVAEMCRQNNYNNSDYSSILQCLCGMTKSARGYVWSYTEMTKEDILARNVNPNAKKVYQYDENGVLVMVFDSLKSTGEHGYDKKSVGECCNGKKEMYKGYKWSYVEK